MRYLNLIKKKKIFLLLYISILVFSSLGSVNTYYKSESDNSLTSSDGIEFNLNDAQFDQKSLPKWNEQNLKADKNENGIDDNFEVRLKQQSEFGFIEENFDRDKEILKKNNNFDDLFKINNQNTEKINLDNIPIIISFPNGDYGSVSLLFEILGGKITSTYKAALNGFAGRISYNPLNEFCDLLIQNDIPFFIEEDMVYEAQLYYAGRNMNLRPYVWNTLSYDGDEYSSIAIIDTGIDDSHNFSTPGYSDADFNYKIVGWRDEVNELTSPYDNNGHGSHCSGISAGEGGPNYDGIGRTVATAAYEWDYTGSGAYSGTYLFNWTRFNVTDPGLIEFFCEFDDSTPDPDDVDFWAYLYYGETIVDSHEVDSDSWSHILSYTATSSDLGLYSFRFNMTLIDHTGDDIVSDFNIRFRGEIHWPFSPNLFGSGDAWKGVAPDAHLVGVKVLDQHGSGSASDIIDGINWVITNKNIYNITTMSLSLGGSSGQLGMITAVNNAVEEGIVTVVSAGNSGPGLNNVGSPGDADNVITVAAMSIDDEITDYSSQGGPSYSGNTVKPDITAPGGSFNNLQMFSTDTNDNDAEGGYLTDGYANDMIGMQGTSMSAPAVAGASNLLIEAMGGHQSWSYTGIEAKRVKALLLMSATETYPLLREMYLSSYSPQLNRGGKDVHEGYGRLNVDIAIEAYTQELALGSTQNAWIASSFDNPLNKHGLGCYVNLNDGEGYNFTLDVPVGADFDLHLYSNNPSSIGEPIMVDSSTSSGLGTDETIYYTATETGKYYLVAKAISGEGDAIIANAKPPGDFILSSNAGTPDDNGAFDLSWSNAERALNYSVYEYSMYITEINESLSLLIEGTEDLTLPLDSYIDGTYYFIVLAHNTYGDTLSNCIEVVVGIPPGDFILSSNAGTPDDNGAFNLSWSNAERALNYSVYEYSSYITEINESLSLLIEGTEDLTLPLNGYLDGTYYFIALAHNTYGDTLSNCIEVVVGIPPGDFILSTNAGTPDDNGAFNLSWSNAERAQNYSVYEYSSYITEINEGLSLLIEGTEDLTLPLDSYIDGTYYFIVVAHNAYGDTLSNCIEVVISIPPGDFILSSNAGTPDDNGAFDLSWTNAERAQNYSVYEYSSYITEINGSLTLLGGGISTISLVLSDYHSGSYYFIVIAYNDFGSTLSNCIKVVVEIPLVPTPPWIPGYNLTLVITAIGICTAIIIVTKKRYNVI